MLRSRLITTLVAVALFGAAFLLYWFTAVQVPLPGASAEFLTALVYPTQGTTTPTSPLDAVLGHWLVNTLGFGMVTPLVALMGATMVAVLFFFAASAVKYYCMDMTGIRDREVARTQSDFSLVALLTGICAALMGMVSLPIWISGTRVLPELLLTLNGFGLLMFAMRLRLRVARWINQERPSSTALWIHIGILFAWATLFGTLAPELLPILLLALILAGGVLVHQETPDRHLFLPWILGGILLGCVASVLLVSRWAALFNPVENADAFRLWIGWMQTQMARFPLHFVTFESAAPITLFTLAAVLLLGCFPKAYLRFASPLFGQLVALGVTVASLLHWPAQLWNAITEPTAMATIGVALSIVVSAVMVGSWARNWLDVHTHWSRPKAHAMAAVLISIPTLLWGAFSIRANAADGSGRLARQTLAPIWAAAEASLPTPHRFWANPPPCRTGLILHCATQHDPIQPLVRLDTLPQDLVLGGMTLAERATTDLLYRELESLGGDSLQLYLLDLARQDGLITGLPPRSAIDVLIAAVQALTDTPFAATQVGQATLKAFQTIAAHALVEAAKDQSPEAAAETFRRAIALDPENIAAHLSLAALPGVSITADERQAATAVLERQPNLRAPSLDEGQKVEQQFGTVQTPAFASTRRLYAMRRGNAADTWAHIQALYQTAPARLSDEERILALLCQAEEAAGQRLNAGSPTDTELKLYLCAYPYSPVAMELFTRHRERLSAYEGLAHLYLQRHLTARQRAGERALSYFFRDGDFAYALFHVRMLLDEGLLNEAIDFASGFSANDLLARTPALLERLRLEILDVLQQQNAQRALEQARAWLLDDPYQQVIWMRLLENPAQPDHGRADSLACLALYPIHPTASAIFAQTLEERVGEAVATRYRKLVARIQAAERAALEAPYANR